MTVDGECRLERREIIRPLLIPRQLLERNALGTVYVDVRLGNTAGRLAGRRVSLTTGGGT